MESAVQHTFEIRSAGPPLQSSTRRILRQKSESIFCGMVGFGRSGCSIDSQTKGLCGHTVGCSVVFSYAQKNAPKSGGGGRISKLDNTRGETTCCQWRQSVLILNIFVISVFFVLPCFRVAYFGQGPLPHQGGKG